MPATILVKKTDGTQVRMTMDEFKEYKKNLSTKALERKSTPVGEEKVVVGEGKQVNKSASEQVVVPEKVEEVIRKKSDTEVRDQRPGVAKNDLPMKDEHHELSTTTPVKNIFVDEALYTKTRKHENTKTQPYPGSSVGVSSIEPPKQNSVKKWTDEDHKSPLEDEVEELKQHESLEVLPDKKQDLFTEVLKKIKFPISDDLQARLHSLISSRIKEVRTDDQFLSYVGRPVDSGGLGLDESQSQELLQTVKDVWHIVSQKKPEKKQTVSKPLEVSKPKEVKKVVSKLNVSLPKSKTGEKPVLHDVLKPKPVVEAGGSGLPELKKQSIGPVDEIRNFSLVDLRRMGNDSADNFKKLLQKFKDLKKDSVVLYMEAVQTWYESPLYKQYQDVMFRALDTGVKARDLAQGGETLTWEEVEGVINLQKKFT